MPATKLAQIQAAWAAADYRTALRIAAKFQQLGTHKGAITRGWAATTNPQFYIEIGQDPDHLYQLGLLAVAARYSLPHPVPTPGE